MRFAPLFCLALALSACRDESAEAPSPVPMTEEAVSFFCQMNVLEHGGPKGQVHLEHYPAPLFFGQTRDALAYLMRPEREARIIASYVSDMGAAPSWEDPGAENWIAAHAAFYVVGSGVAGGMGAPEIVPFADRTVAEAFALRNGGAVMAYPDIPDDAVFAPIDLSVPLKAPS